MAKFTRSIRKEFKKVPKPFSSDALYENGQYTGKWQYVDSLQFLKGIVVPRTTEGNISHVEDLHESQTRLLDNDDIENEQSSVENSANMDFALQVSVTADVSQEIVKKVVDLVEELENTVGQSNLPYKQVELLSLQVYVEDFKFAIFGCIPLDWTLFHSMLAGVASYLVILHQLNTMENMIFED
ncbi:hypothetical protein FQR65_LT18704 [Abscondita terminalis]|nr:hypothetical protein FQR65_LT18704 [Abscondita terminalis]